jgi:hypothetical protein
MNMEIVQFDSAHALMKLRPTENAQEEINDGSKQ